MMLLGLVREKDSRRSEHDVRMPKTVWLSPKTTWEKPLNRRGHGTTQDKNEGIWMGHEERQEQSRLKTFDLNKRQKEKSEMIYYNWLWYFHLIIKIIIKLIK